MRFRSLHLLRFGLFTDHRLRFGEGEGRLHLIYGKNESGKSTALRAIGDFLFGFGQKVRDDFLHDRAALRVGAELLLGDGRSLELYRKRGHVRTLLDAEGHPVDGDPVAPLLGAWDRRGFERMFGLDHQRLRQGGQELLEGGGNVALGLFQAGAGTGQVRELLESLDAEADQLFRPRGSTQRINARLKEYRDQREQTQSSAASPSEYHTIERELGEVEEQLADHGHRASSLESKWLERQRVRTNLRDLAQRRMLLAELDELKAVPDPSEGAVERRRAAEKQLLRARSQRELAVQQLEQLRLKRERLQLRQPILDATNEIEALDKMLARVSVAADDLPKREANLELSRQSIEALLHNLKLSVTVEQVRTALPTPSQIQLLRTLAEEGDKTEQLLAELSIQLSELDRERELLARELHALPNGPDPRPLEQTLQRLRSEPTEARLQEHGREAASALQRLEQTLNALPLWSGKLEQLRVLAVPLSETVTRFSSSWQERATASEQAERQLAEAEQTERLAARELEHAGVEPHAPSQDDVRAARGHRDAGWDLLRRGYVDGTEDVAAAAKAYDPERSLAEAYEAAVQSADQLADRRQADTARAARHEQARVAFEEARRVKIACQERVEAARAAAAELRRGWAAQWTALCTEPLPPLEMRDWLRERSRILELGEQAEQATTRHSEIQTRLIESRQTLVRALEQAGLPASEELGLADLLEQAELGARQLRSASELRTRLTEALGQSSTKREILAGRVRQQQDRQGELKEQWKAALSAIGKDEQLHPLEARALLDGFEELRVKLTQWQEAQHRVDAMHRDRQALEGSLARLLPELMPELGQLSALDAAQQLTRLHKEAVQAKARRDEIDQDLENAEQQLEAAQQEIQTAESELAILCERWGCSASEDLEAMEARAARKQRAILELRELEKQLVKRGDGLDIEQLVQEARGAELDALTLELGDIENQRDSERAQITVLAERRGQLRQKLANMTGGDDAARSSQKAALLACSLRRDAEQWALVKVAADLLRRGLQRYRELNQGPVIGLASERFCQLTLGRYPRLAVDYDEQDQPVLKGVRDTGSEVAIDQLSDGTCDQLHLALRLAVLEQLLDKGERLPVVADDLLVHFDDERSAAALEALSELARRTQVLYFTHHATIVELAKERLDPDRLVVHQLPG